MKLHFRSNDLEGQLWQRRAADRLGLALRRLHRLVAGIKVRLDDINGPAGGVDKRCSVEVIVRGIGPVAVNATARTWQDSVETAASQVRRRVVMQLHRAKSVEVQPAAPAVAPAARCSARRQLRLG